MALDLMNWGDSGNFGSVSSGTNGFQAQSRLEGDVQNLAPLATSYHVQQPNQPVGFTQPFQTQGNLSKFTSFVGTIGKEIGHVAGAATKWLATNTANMVEAPVKLGAGLGHGILDRSSLDSVNAQNDQLSTRMDNLLTDFKSGRISKSQYSAELKSLNQDYNNLISQNKALDGRLALDQQNTTKAMIDTAGTLVTILTAGLGRGSALTAEGIMPSGELSAAQFLKSEAAGAYLSATESKLGTLMKLEVFNKLSTLSQGVIDRAAAEVVANSSRMSAGEISRATAVNLALKYPIFYNYLSGQGTDLYNELDNQKYGAAVRTLAFNALLALSGGPIGAALKYGGKSLSSVSARTFGQTAFWDELSKYYGDGNVSGFAKAAANLSEEDIKNLSAVEATNVAATGDAVSAAYRLAQGMKDNYGFNLSEVTHEDGLKDMINFSKAQRLADDTAKAHDLGSVTVGRVDARALNEISAKVSMGNSVEERLALWEQAKADNPSQAWANNQNLDKQIKNLINTHQDSASLDSSIRSIKAQFSVKGFPKSVAAQLSKMGYIPIKPGDLEAPFAEGTGKITSRFGEGDAFIRSVAPLPILGHIGSLLTRMGLSPEASTQRVYQVFNANLADNLSNLDIAKGMVGESSSQTADTIVKRLSDYAKNPTRGGITIGTQSIRPPITDLRQLTLKDIQTALDVSKTDARQVRAAVMDAMIQVPLQIRGLGDRIVDLNYKINPLAKGYARLQGATRFSWNPFFQAKLSYKTEFLSQLEAGGKFPTLLGTNKVLATIMPGKYAQLDDIRTVLRDQGIFETRPTFGAVSGEAVADGSAVGSNLTHKLLPGQERSIAGLVAVQSEKAGMSVEDFVKTFPAQVRDTVQMIAQYDRNSAFLNSAMARTLNFAFFPFRFEYKVGAIMARSLARTSPLTQLAVIHGLYNGSNFLKSPEGQQWYSQNAEVIGLLKYFTPLTTLSELGQVLGQRPTSLGNFGELGGLPFGWIPQLLDAEGITHGLTQPAYVDPHTGQVIPQYVPVTARGHLLTAIQDLLGSLFTYPGATTGLPSKTSITRNIALGITGANKKVDLRSVTPTNLSPQQQSFQRTLQGSQSTSQSPINQPPALPITVPQLQTSATTPTPRSSFASSRTSKKKKAQFTPALLPGQSSLGQL